MYSKEESQQLRKEFWASFSNYTIYYSKKIGQPIEWILYKTGIKGLELKFDIEKKVVRVAIEVNCKNEEKRFDIFVELDKYKSIIENDFIDKLTWTDEFILPEGKTVSRIYTELVGVKYHNRDNWPVIFKFLAENMFKFQSNFIDIQPILIEKFGK